MDPAEENRTLHEYAQVCNNFRMLTDIRFKLIALLPIATAAAAAFGTKESQVPSAWLSAFGLLATLAIATYNERNNQLYDDLVDRAAAIERLLGLQQGAFANRPGAWLSILVGNGAWKVDHRFSLTLLYTAAAAVWLFGLLHWAGKSVQAVMPQRYTLPEPVAQLLLLVGAVGVASYIAYSISRTKERRKRQVDRRTYRLTKRALNKNWTDLANDGRFKKLCATLLEPVSSHKKQRAAYEKISRRIEYFRDLTEKELRYYMELEPPRTKAVYIVALLSDLSYVSVLKRYANR